MKITSIFNLIIVVLLSVYSIANAEIYKYKDASGNVKYVDDPNKIPVEFRTDIKPHELPEIQREGRQPAPVVKSKRRTSSSSSVEDIERQLAELGGPREEPNLNTISNNTSTLPTQEAFALSGGILLFACIAMFLNIIAYWILLNRAGLPGFGILIPIYNLVLMSRLAGKSGWWMLWLFIPFLGPIIWGFSVNFLTAKNFGRGDLFAIANVFIPFILVPVMAFSSE